MRNNNDWFSHTGFMQHACQDVFFLHMKDISMKIKPSEIKFPIETNQ